MASIYAFHAEHYGIFRILYGDNCECKPLQAVADLIHTHINRPAVDMVQ